MTGFSKATGKIKGGVLSVEIKSFNHRFFEVTTRLPQELLIYEEEIKRRLKERIRRGSINVLFIYFSPQGNIKSVNLDERVVKQYTQIAKLLSKKIGLRGEWGISDFLNLPGVLVCEEKHIDLSKEWGECRKVLDKAIDKLLVSKEKEGRVLLKDVLANIQSAENSLKKIQMRTKHNVGEFKRKIQLKCQALAGLTLTKEKLMEETSLFLRNTDISEEIVRVRGHLVEMRNLLKKEEEVGRKLDFMAQEAFREANTIGAKANDYLISHEVVLIKSYVEKIREQVQNLE
ncbi:MAG: YicC family protein [Candidatus Omnitrophica bacterium]|nr:YicC family protein [Candidatus Omnitrophota bacterium]